MAKNATDSGPPDTQKAPLSGNLIGAFYLVLSGLAFTVYLLMSKLLSTDVHPMLLAFWRAFLGTSLGLFFIFRSGGLGGLRVMKTKRAGLVVGRSLFSTVGLTLSMLAVSAQFSLTLAQFNAISFTRPLFVTILAALVLRETVGIHRWGAVFIGFFGVTIMMAPGALTFWRPGALSDLGLGMGSLLALGSAFSLAGSLVLVKILSGELPPVALQLYANSFSALVLIPFLFIYQAEYTLIIWLKILGMSGAGFVAQFFYISAMRAGEASFIASIDYVRMPLSAVADFMVFRLIPGLNVWFGAVIIVISTLYIGLRERRKKTAPKR